MRCYAHLRQKKSIKILKKCCLIGEKFALTRPQNALGVCGYFYVLLVYRSCVLSLFIIHADAPHFDAVVAVKRLQYVTHSHHVSVFIYPSKSIVIATHFKHIGTRSFLNMNICVFHSKMAMTTMWHEKCDPRGRAATNLLIAQSIKTFISFYTCPCHMAGDCSTFFGKFYR